MESGQPIDLENLSEEEDADFYHDHKLRFDTMSLVNPLLANSQYVLKLQLSFREQA